MGLQTGASVQVTGRKAPSYLDAMFATRLFWDGRAECVGEDCPAIDAFEDPDNPGTFPIASGAALENQAVGPPLSDVEMACESASWAGIHEKLGSVVPLALASDIPEDVAAFITEHGGSYPAMFEAVFGSAQTSGPDDEINTRRIAFAIATHERRLTSNQTPFDRFNEGEDDALTAAQIRGLALYTGRATCAVCHAPPLFVDDQFHFTGFHRPEWDMGRFSTTANEVHRAKMRTPTLRNVGLRLEGGLLHAGREHSLEEIIRVYAAGGRLEDTAIAEFGVDSGLVPFEVSDDEIADMVDFLVNGLTDPRVANEEAPFDRPTLGSE
jgi:cytochrome c peroxidase